MTEPLNHKLDTSKIKTLKDVRNVFDCMNLVYNGTETHEHYELLKKYFTIPYHREDFLPEPMKKYRIKKVNHTILGSLYYPQKRVFLFFWENVYSSKSSFVGYYTTYDGALEDIKKRVENKKVEYFYNLDL